MQKNKIDFFKAKNSGISLMSVAVLLAMALIYFLAPDQYQEINNEILGDVYEDYYVSKIVDGDTIKVIIDGEEQTVRLIGVDTPETVHPNKDVECYGLEASDFTKSLLTNKIVELEFDESQGQTDRYGRLLAYVYRADDHLFVNRELIKQGYAYEYTYNTPYKYQTEFQQDQEIASASKIGLWSDICAPKYTL
ncbi:thermonuclease family protein [Candidatus Dojkabacteria bacterium]|uniref:Thermonuclease family protein n=1 Tax=Candidatus Dojkabacteria bacterium TaxID=2099670 RepID=A0A955RJ43_9BACT|nr:thermonuclease family protein [Candidatus Dojkabacteria bacterium]